MRFLLLFIFVVFNLTSTSQAINPQHNTLLLCSKTSKRTQELPKSRPEVEASRRKIKDTEAFSKKLSAIADEAEKDFQKLHKRGKLDLSVSSKNANLLKQFVIRNNQLINPTGTLDTDDDGILKAHKANNRLNRLQNEYESVAKELNWNQKNNKGFTKLPVDMSIDALVAAGNNLPELQKNGSYQTGSTERYFLTTTLGSVDSVLFMLLSPVFLFWQEELSE